MMQNVIKNWAKLSQATRSLPKGSRALLASSISSLTPRIETVGFDELFAQLNDELKAKKIIHLTIDTYWGDEWFCPDKTTAIAIPFWLADERLKKIERSIVGFVEGETDEEFMRLMRHEAGHCVEHAYRLSRRQDWRDVFGNPQVKYDPDSVKGIFIHWLIINIPKNSNVITSGTSIKNYYKPSPPPKTGKHRYIFELYRHDAPIHVSDKEVSYQYISEILKKNATLVKRLAFLSENKSQMGGSTNSRRSRRSRRIRISRRQKVYIKKTRRVYKYRK